MKNKTYNLIASAIFAALIFVATRFIAIPLPGSGYANLGDTIIIIAALILPLPYSMAAAAIGSALADLSYGLAIYAPATFVIKALMSFIVFIIAKAFKSHRSLKFVHTVICAAACEIFMVLGYFLFELCLYGAPTAIADILGNAGQGAAGIVCGSVLYTALKKSNALRFLRK